MPSRLGRMRARGSSRRAPAPAVRTGARQGRAVERGSDRFPARRPGAPSRRGQVEGWAGAAVQRLGRRPEALCAGSPRATGGRGASRAKAAKRLVEASRRELPERFASESPGGAGGARPLELESTPGESAASPSRPDARRRASTPRSPFIHTSQSAASGRERRCKAKDER
jgi:hypothetical protein